MGSLTFHLDLEDLPRHSLSKHKPAQVNLQPKGTMTGSLRQVEKGSGAPSPKLHR